MEIIPLDILKNIAGREGFNVYIIEKDYYLTLLLYFLRKEKLYFKGGTALHKIYLNYRRLSEDLDFSYKGNIEIIKNKILKLKIYFKEISIDKETKDFIRFLIFYRSHFGIEEKVIIDINKKSSILYPDLRQIYHFYYPYIPRFKINTLNYKELVAEKIRALVQRNQPRDYYDLYIILKKGFELNTINEIIIKKFEETQDIFSVRRIFNRANKIYSSWKTDLEPVVREEVNFLEVIKFLKKKFSEIKL